MSRCRNKPSLKPSLVSTNVRFMVSMKSGACFLVRASARDKLFSRSRARKPPQSLRMAES